MFCADLTSLDLQQTKDLTRERDDLKVELFQKK